MGRDYKADDVRLQKTDLDRLLLIKHRQYDCTTLPIEVREEVSMHLTKAFRLLEDNHYGVAANGHNGRSNGANGFAPRAKAKGKAVPTGRKAS